MSIIDRTDVKDHMRPPFLAKIHLCPPKSQLDAAGFSEAEPSTMNATQSEFASDFVAEHSSSSSPSADGRPLRGSFHPETPTAPKSAKA